MVSWKDDCDEAGIDVLFKHGRKLVGAKHRLSVMRVIESQFPMMWLCTLNPGMLWSNHPEDL